MIGKAPPLAGFFMCDVNQMMFVDGFTDLAGTETCNKTTLQGVAVNGPFADEAHFRYGCAKVCFGDNDKHTVCILLGNEVIVPR